MRNASFLEAQRHMESAQGINNLRSIFGVDNIPTDNYIRSILDSVSPSYLEPVFKDIFSYLENSKHIDEFRVGDGRLLIAIDGTQYHSSKKIYCEQCNSSKHKNGDVTFSHGVVMPVLVKPGRKQVLPLFPEFIVPQDGHVKQDCENPATKRLIVLNAAFYRERQAIILGDALYCCQPLCQLLRVHELDFVFVCKPTSHEVLFKRVEELSATGKVKTLEVQCEEKRKLVTYKYRYLNNIPIRGGSDAIDTNW